MLFWICPVWYSLCHGHNEIKYGSETYILIFFSWNWNCIVIFEMCKNPNSNNVHHRWISLWTKAIKFFTYSSCFVTMKFKIFVNGIFAKGAIFVWQHLLFVSETQDFFCCLAVVIPFCIKVQGTSCATLHHLYWPSGRILMFSGSEGHVEVFLTLTIVLKTFMVFFNANISITLL